MRLPIWSLLPQHFWLPGILSLAAAVLLLGVVTTAFGETRLEQPLGEGQVTAAIRRSIATTWTNCAEVMWQSRDIPVLNVNYAVVAPQGTAQICDVSRVRLATGEPNAQTLDLPFFAPGTLVIRSLLLIGLSLLLTGVTLYLLRFGRKPVVEYMLVAGCALGLTLILSVFTNTNRSLFGAVVDGYAVIAQYGFSEPELLRAPYVFRPVIPLLINAITNISGVSIPTASLWLTVLFSTTQLTATYALARRFGASMPAGLVIVLLMWLAVGMVKNELYFYASIESLTYTLLTLFFLFYLRGSYGLCLAITIFGFFVREFALLAGVILCVALLKGAVRERSLKKALWLGLTVAACSAAVIIPRLILRNIQTEQYLDPFNAPDASVGFLTSLPLNWSRNLNILIGLISFFMPGLLLLTPLRWQALRRALGPHIDILVLWVLVVLALTMYGGTDLYRYLTFLYLSLVLVLAVLLSQSEQPVRVGEAAAVIAWTLVHNQTAAYIVPFDLDGTRYLAYWPAFSDIFSNQTLRRAVEMVLGLAGAAAIRWYLFGRAGTRAAVQVPEPAQAA